MRLHRIYACEDCGRSIIRSNRTDRRKLCPQCAADAVEARARRNHEAAQARRGWNVVYLPTFETTYPQGAA